MVQYNTYPPALSTSVLVVYLSFCLQQGSPSHVTPSHMSAILMEYIHQPPKPVSEPIAVGNILYIISLFLY